MPECEFEQRPDIRWRRQYAKGEVWSRKRQRTRLFSAWCPAERFPKAKSVTLHDFIQKPRRNYTSLVEYEFLRLAAKWKDDTRHWSSVTRMVAHPNYLRIIGLATVSKKEVEQLLLKELRNEPDHWFPALTAITGEDPTSPEDDFDKAVNAWLEWGHQRGIA